MPIVEEAGGPTPQEPPTQAKAKKTKVEKAEKEKVYPTIEERPMRDADAMTVAQAKEFLGWEEVKVRDAACNPAIATLTGLNVRLNKCHKQRPLDDVRWLRTLRQTHLNGRWVYNGKTVELGEYGAVLDGQYRMVSLACAEHERTKGPEAKHWQRVHPEPLTMETLLVTGLDEGDEMFATFNAVLAGTAADTIYRTGLFSKYSSADRKKLSDVAAYAVRVLWDRTGAAHNAWAPHLDVLSCIEFLKGHPRVRDCCVHVWEEDGKGASKDEGGQALSQWLGLGACAALCYLFGASSTRPDDYLKADGRGERQLDLARYDKACEFWVALAGGSDDLDAAREALNDLVLGDDKAPRDQVTAVLVLAWDAFLSGRPFTAKDVWPEFLEEKDDDGQVVGRYLTDHPRCGGIDLGPSPKADKPEEEPPVEPIRQEEGEETAPSEQRTLGDEVAEYLAKYRKANKGFILVFKSTAKMYSLWEDDALVVAKLLGLRSKPADNGLDKLQIKEEALHGHLTKLSNLGHSVRVLEESGAVIREYVPADGSTAPTAEPPTEAPKKDGSKNGKPTPPPPKQKGKKASPLRGGTNS